MALYKKSYDFTLLCFCPSMTFSSSRKRRTSRKQQRLGCLTDDELYARSLLENQKLPAASQARSAPLQRTASVTGPQVPPRANSLRTSRSVSSNARLQRQRSLKKEDEKVKRNRRSSLNYELSQDLRDKQVEMLEKKYGGSIRSRHAARTIQQAFRQYTMNKNFERLRQSAKGEKRLERRYTESRLMRSDSIWDDIVISTSESDTMTPVLSRSDSHRPRSLVNDENFNAHREHPKQKVIFQRSKALSTDDSESNNNKKSYSDFVQSLERKDLSVVFDNGFDSKDMNLLNDSFDSPHGSGSLTRAVRETDITYEDYSVSSSADVSRQSNSTSIDQWSFNQSLDQSCDQSLDQARLAYTNSEVKLRSKNKPSDLDLSVGKQDQKGGPPKESPIWKRKTAIPPNVAKEDSKRMSNISEASEDNSVDGRLSSSSSSATSLTGDSSVGYQRQSRPSLGDSSLGDGSIGKDLERTDSRSRELGRTESLKPKMSDKQRKRQYRIGLNMFNKKPERGLRYLIERKFVENSSKTVARFLITRKGVSKQMIGEYLGNLQNQFNQDVLDHFVDEIDLTGLSLDVALRKFQTYFRMPGEAQKIERLMEAFAHRYCVCNPLVDQTFRSRDTVFLLAFAIIMLNTDLHSPSMKSERRMKLSDFIKNLRGIDDGEDIDYDFLVGIYERVKNQEFRAGVDHVTQVGKVEQTVIGKKPPLSLPHRRLVCYCRLYEVIDLSKKEKLSLHQREVFLFNDLLLITKIFSKKKNLITYSYRSTFPLNNIHVFLCETQHYQYVMQLKNQMTGKTLITLNARNDHDRMKFVEDLNEAIEEVNEMEQIRIEEELQKHHLVKQTCNRHSNDSGMVDFEGLKHNMSDSSFNRLSVPDSNNLRKSALSNSLIDLAEGKVMERRGSGGSLDSGMVSVGSICSNSREESPQQAKGGGTRNKDKKSAKVSKTKISNTTSSSEV